MSGKKMIRISMRLRSYLLGLGMLTIMGACQKEVLDPQESIELNNTSKELDITPINPGEPLALDISGDLESFSTGNGELRTLELDNRPDQVGDSPLIYTKRQEQDWGVFYFKKFGSNNVTKRALKYSIIPVDGSGNEVEKSTKAQISITVRPATKSEATRDQVSLTLNNGETFDDGDWYISGILGTGENLKEGNLNNQTFNSFSASAPSDLRNAIEWDPMDTQRSYRTASVPIKLKWSKLNTGTSTIGGQEVRTASSKDLKFSVVGSILSLNARSDMFDDVRITGVYLKSYGLSFNGVFAENNPAMGDDALKKGEDAPFSYQQRDAKEWDRATAREWSVLYANFFKGTERGSVLTAGAQSASYLKLLVMPIVPPTKTYERRHRTHAAWIVTKADQTVGAGRSILQTLNIKTKVAPADDESTNGVVEGRFYNANINLETDLMISEVFNHNPAGNNYGWIEIYNGTLRTIDLSDYAVGKSKYVVYGGKGYYIPIPDPVTSHGTYMGAGFGQAAIQPLTMETTAPLNKKTGRLNYDQSLFDQSIMKAKWWNPHTSTMTAMGIDPQSHTVEAYHGREKIFVGNLEDRIADKYEGEGYTHIAKTPAEKRMLPPGKTVILLMSGYFRDLAWGTPVTPAVTWNINTATGNDGYLHGPQMFRAYKAGYVHDIMVSFSGANEAFQATNYYTYARSYSAPVLSKANYEGVFLVRRLPNGIKRYIDAFCAVDGSSSKADGFYNRMQKAKKMIYVRRDHILFPDYGASTDQWDYSEYSSGYQYSYPITDKVWTSAGTRYKHDKIRPNYPDKYDGSDTYDKYVSTRNLKRQW